jgi:hypothetical protein
MKILDSLIKKIDEELTDARQSNPFEERLYGDIHFLHYDIRYSFSSSIVELEIHNKKRDTYLDNVSDYCETKVIDWNDIEVDDSSDEWDDHGFANESDYMRYRYG